MRVTLGEPGRAHGEEGDPLAVRLRRHAGGIMALVVGGAAVGLAGLLPPGIPWWVPAASLSVVSVLIASIYSVRPGARGVDVHARAAIQAMSLTVVTYLSGWGFTLPFVHLFGIADNIDESGPHAGRVSLGWAAVMTAAAQVGVELGYVPVTAISVRSSHLVAGITVVLLFLVTQRLRVAAAERERAIDELDRSERRFRTLVEDATDVLLLLDDDLRITYASPSLRRVVGTARDVIGASYLDVVHDDDEARVAAIVADFAAGDRDPTLTQFRITRPDGTVARVEASHRDLRADGAVGGIVAILRDVTDRHRLEQALEHGRQHDAHTGLPNRAALEARCDALLRSRGAAGLGMLAIGLDGLEAIAAAAGREAVDDVVAAIAFDVTGVLRETNVLARTGEARFGIIATELDGVAALHTVAERLRTVVDRTVEVPAATLPLTASVGFMPATADSTGRDLVRATELALTSARSSESRIALFDESLRAALGARLAAEQDLKRAIAEGEEFVLHYQPLVALDDDATADELRLVGVEALVRWEHPERGLLCPAEFIPLAEETGMIVDLGWWVLDEAVAQLTRWDEQLGIGSVGYVSVNVSMLQFTGGELAGRVAQTLARLDVAPRRVVLELTETALAQDPERTMPQLSMLASMGVQLAVDDFGTGYSSMAYLQQFPVDVLKIDRAFVATSAPMHRPELLASLRQLGEALGLRTVAEGIETEEELGEVRRLRFDIGQGFLFGRPVPPSAITDLLLDRQGGRAPAVAADHPPPPPPPLLPAPTSEAEAAGDDDVAAATTWSAYAGPSAEG